MFIDKEQEVEEVVETTETTKEVEEVKDNSTIKTMREEIKNLKKENSNLKQENETFSKQQTQLDKLVEKDLINTYGNENLDDAKKLIDAGFEESKIKEMLNKTDDLSTFDEPDPLPKEIKGDGAIEEDKEEPYNPTIGIEKQTY